MDAETAGSNKGFTSRKLDWLDAVMADPRIKPQDFEVAYCIMQHVSAATGQANVSDATIADKTGQSLSPIKRSRRRLKKLNWISWKRTGEENVYTPLWDNVSNIQDHQQIKKEARVARYQAKTARRFGREIGPARPI